jgi:Ca-activated chloride channel family protein
VACRRRPSAGSWAAALVLAFSAALAGAAFAAPAPAPPAGPAQELGPRHRDFLVSVEILMSPVERQVFLALRQPYQRDAFIRRFWKVRDPFPRTEQSEIQVRWEEHSRLALAEFGDLQSEMARTLVFFGEPSRRLPLGCGALRETLELWFYNDGVDSFPQPFAIVFRGRGPHARRWRPTEGIASLADIGAAGLPDDRVLAMLGESCPRADDLFAALGQAIDVERALEAGLFPKPNDEWALAFAARSTELGADAEPLTAPLSLTFPGRNQSRTAVQGFVQVPRAELTPAALGDHSFYNVLVDGEVLRQGELFETFRYRFDFPAATVAEQIPLILQRYLRPGPYKLILRVQDVNSQRAARHELDLEVPQVDPAKLATSAPAGAAPAPIVDLGTAPPPEAGAAPIPSPEQIAARAQVLDAALSEANATINAGDQVIKILPLPAGLQIGRLRVEARARGEGIARVAFDLNGRGVMRKAAPPYSVELDLGAKPRLHTVRASALDADGKVLASDEMVLNAGPHRFAVRLVEPQPGKPYQQSLRAAAEVELPEGETLDRVELFLNEDRVATLYQPPFEQPILLPPGGGPAYVRVVGYLSDGNSAEDVRFVNAPDYVDQLDVQFVELYTTVVDRGGDFVDGLEAKDFVVEEDGKAQEVRRFERIRNQPIRAGLIIDTSLSMETKLREVEKAAYRFLETVLQPRDRAAVITFNDKPKLAVKFTNERSILAGGLAGLQAEGETALYDSLLFGLHYFSGITGKRALIVLTDGEDSASSYQYDDVLEFARHAGISIYVIGLGLTSNQQETRSKLGRLASETGGATFYIENAGQLGRIYDDIQLELRSQYLLAYQSTQPIAKTGFREVKVKVAKGLEAKTIRGYYP